MRGAQGNVGVWGGSHGRTRVLRIVLRAEACTCEQQCEHNRTMDEIASVLGIQRTRVELTSLRPDSLGFDVLPAKDGGPQRFQFKNEGRNML